MGPFWNYCFFCFSPSKQVEVGQDELGDGMGGRRRSRRRAVVVASSAQSFNESYAVTLKYLLGVIRTKEEQCLYQDIVNLYNPGPGGVVPLGEVLIRFCKDCEKKMESVMELQIKLEGIQEEIMEKVKEVREELIKNSQRNDKNFERFEKWLELGEEMGRDCEVEKKFLDVLKRFRIAVFEKDVQPPRSILGAIASQDETFGGGRANQIKEEAELEYDVEDLNDYPELGSDVEYNPPMELECSETEESVATTNPRKSKAGEANSCRRTSKRITPQKKKLPTKSTRSQPERASKIRYKEDSGNNSESAKDLEGDQGLKSRVPKKRKKKTLDPDIFRCKLCDFQCYRASEWKACLVERHLQTHEISTKKKHKCVSCNLKFTHDQIFERHLRKHEKEIKCDVCDKFVTAVKMEDHLKNVHGNDQAIYSCKYCDFVCGTYPALALHTVLEAGEAETKCELCPADVTEEFAARGNLLKHLYEIHGCSGVAFVCEEPECGQVFYDEKWRSRHMTIHQRRYACHVCNKAYIRPSELQLHVKVNHERVKDIECDQCSETFFYKTTLESHKRQKHGAEKLKCDLCPGKEYNQIRTLQRHMVEYHSQQTPNSSRIKLDKNKTRESVGKTVSSSGRTFKCQLCPVSCERALDWKACFVERHLKSHEDSSTEKKKYQCTYCNQEFAYEQTWKRHLIKHESKRKCDICEEMGCSAEMEEHLKADHPSNKIYTCEFCDFVCGSYLALALHTVLEPGELEVKCDLCPPAEIPDMFGKRGDLLKHLYETHGCADVAFVCEEPNCGQVFHDVKLRSRHMVIHKRRHVCTYCDRAFIRPSELQDHVRVEHEREKSFQCDVCPEAFFYQRGLDSHKAAKHGAEESTYTCNLCPLDDAKQFFTKNALVKHKTACHKSHPFKCDTCEKTFPFKHKLVNHEKIHTGVKGEKNLFCELCGFATRHRKSWKLHLQRHKDGKIGDYITSCPVCQKPFRNKNTFDRHMREQHRRGETSVSCDICGTTLSGVKQLERHKQTRHSSPDEGKGAPVKEEDADVEESDAFQDWS